MFSVKNEIFLFENWMNLLLNRRQGGDFGKQISLKIISDYPQWVSSNPFNFGFTPAGRTARRVRKKPWASAFLFMCFFQLPSESRDRLWNLACLVIIHSVWLFLVISGCLPSGRPRFPLGSFFNLIEMRRPAGFCAAWPSAKNESVPNSWPKSKNGLKGILIYPLSSLVPRELSHFS